jgi:hypothetical protein
MDAGVPFMTTRLTDVERVWVECRRAEDPDHLATVPDEKIVGTIRRWPALATDPRWLLPALRRNPLALP